MIKVDYVFMKKSCELRQLCCALFTILTAYRCNNRYGGRFDWFTPAVRHHHQPQAVSGCIYADNKVASLDYSELLLGLSRVLTQGNY